MVTLDSDKQLCEQMMNNMLRHDPFMHIRFVDTIVCNVYAFDDIDDTSGVFMVQQVYDFPKKNYCLWSFWECDGDLDAVSHML